MFHKFLIHKSKYFEDNILSHISKIYIYIYLVSENANVLIYRQRLEDFFRKKKKKEERENIIISQLERATFRSTSIITGTFLFLYICTLFKIAI